MAHTELDLVERRGIEEMLNAKMPIREIAEELGRHRSSIYREIKRNGFLTRSCRISAVTTEWSPRSRPPIDAPEGASSLGIRICASQ